ncbi:MAG: hypothetical protein Q7N50_06535, partial [Armatimonadota bacterium]|nr:hypothetical protein [Armatimonadota bacterium]
VMGKEGAILMRGQHAWMMREADSTSLGWTTIARSEKIGDEMGIVLLADSTKLIEEGKEPGKDAVEETGKDELYYSVEEFLANVRSSGKVSCGPKEGFNAAVVAIKANEAVVTGTKITYQKEWFDLS